MCTATASKVFLQRAGETRLTYVRRARAYAKRAETRLESTGDYRHCHRSFLVRDALLATETAFPDLGTFGVEGSEAGRGRRSPAFDYLNTGETYELTVLYIRGRYTVGTWGDIVERGDYA